MSRCYELRIKIMGHKPERILEICGALHAQWNFDPSGFPAKCETPEELDLSGVDNLVGGLTAQEMADRLAHVVWQVNGAYCKVEVWSTDLALVPPSDVHTWNAGDHLEWREKPTCAGASARSSIS